MKNGHRTTHGTEKTDRPRKVRFAVVGLNASSLDRVLPGFNQASQTSQLVALVSNDRRKMKAAGKRYKIPHCCQLDEYDQLLKSQKIDAVYLAMPSTLYADYIARACQAGIHVLCEKPMEVGEARKLDLIKSCRENNVILMFAYRLQFAATDLQAMRSTIKQTDIFDAIYSLQGTEQASIQLHSCDDDSRLNHLGGYCINAARYLFQNEPQEVVAFTTGGQNEFACQDGPESASIIMRFPDNRLTSFICNVASDVEDEPVVHSRGSLLSRTAAGPAHVSTAAELMYFSSCILRGKLAHATGRAITGSRLSPEWNLRRPVSAQTQRRKTAKQTSTLPALPSDAN